MGFYLRKSVRVGPIRFNLSKSGIGISSGIPGFRIGIGPRGTYVHMGRGGFYYRQTIAPSEQSSQRFPAAPGHYPRDLDTHGPMESVASGAVSQMVDTDSLRLLNEIEQKRRRLTLWPFALATLFIAILGLLSFNVTLWLAVPFVLLGVLGVVAAYEYDILTKSVVVMYDLDGQSLSAYQEIVRAAELIASCGGKWHIHERADVYDSRYHAGASHLVGRNRISIGFHDPPYVRTNVPVPAFECGRRRLYFLPDYILVYAPDGVGALPYDGVQFSINTSRFIEEGVVPFDAIVVDDTWRYVNKNGSPDRRFKDNRQIPICNYESLRMSTAAGFVEVLQLSRLGISCTLTSSVATMVAGIRQALLIEDQRRQYENNARKALHQKQDVYSEPASVVLRYPSAKELEVALFELLCCVMIVDGRASRNEKAIIRNVMASATSEWSSEDGESRISSFIREVEVTGFRKVLDRSLARLDLFKQVGCEAVIVQCIGKLVTGGQDPSDGKRRELCKRIQRELGAS
jgi:hypothetical protein